MTESDADRAERTRQDSEASSGGFLPRRFKLALFGIAALVLLASPLWGPLVMRRMAFFHVRRVEILGTRYVAPGDILARLNVDTMASVWDPTPPLNARIAELQQVDHAVVTRKLPGTLVIEITERTPVALVSANGGLRVYDERGIPLPIDLARVTVDAPVLMQRDTTVLRLLGAMRARMPAVYARISTVRRVGAALDELMFQFQTQPVHAMQDVTLERLAEVEFVEADLNRKQLRATEIDLRYRDQVIARLQ